ITDISKRKNLETERLTGKKLESIGILAGGIAHDFNNLLSIITGNISMLKVDDNIRNHQQKMLDIMGKAAGQAAELAHKLISFSKGQWINRRPIETRSILNELLREHFAALDSTANFKMDIPDDFPILGGDPSQLKQVFISLMKNSIEAIEDSPRKEITVTAENIGTPDPGLPLKGDKYVKISFLDTGKGIREEHLGKIFDPYFTTKEMGTQKGLGLGLTLCYSTVKKHRGYIRAISPSMEDNTGGTRIDIYLPLPEDDESTITPTS
ncbi:MAG: hypothetical protein GY940_08970, partial [bacterium]|nr:hypothetical protein [bacterium]